MSLVPSVTETLLAWGVGVVACTRFCEQPDLPHVGGTKDPDIGAIAALAPDLVVVDTEENRRPDADALEAAGLALHVTSVRAMADVAPALGALAAAVGLGADALPGTAQCAPLAGAAGPVVRAFVPVWRRPWMTVNGDTYASTLLAAAGAANVCAEMADRYPEVTMAEVTARAPDVVLAPTEPYPFTERHVAELAGFAPRVALVNGQDVTWWGVRTPAALERLREVVGALAAPAP